MPETKIILYVDCNRNINIETRKKSKNTAITQEMPRDLGAPSLNQGSKTKYENKSSALIAWGLQDFRSPVPGTRDKDHYIYFLLFHHM